MEPIRPVDRDLVPPVQRIERRAWKDEEERERERKRRRAREQQEGVHDEPGADDDDEGRPRIDVRA